MSKTSGLGDNFYFGGVNISNDVASISRMNGGPAALDFTGVDKSARERIGGKRDGGFAGTAYFNPTLAHPALSALPTADVIAQYARGTVLGNASAVCLGKQINYDGKRGNDGAFMLDFEVLSDDFGIEWGVQLTPGQRTDTTATNGASVDQTVVSTAFGWQAYLQVFAGFAGTSVTVKVQDSADNSTFADLSGAAFTAANGITTQRIASAGATDIVRRYVRVATTGTFTSATFAVVFVRNATAVVF